MPRERDPEPRRDVQPDAQPAQPGPGWRERRVAPRHADVWCRIAGTWRPGRITAWFTGPGARSGWQVQVVPDHPADRLPWAGRYVYDPAAIRPRYSGEPPL